MSLDAIFSRRCFESPYVKAREEIGPISVLWALIFGPAYYWRKRAPVEALVYFLLTVPMVGLADFAEAAGLPDSVDIGMVLWIGFAAAAPALLAACYRRKGWAEVSASKIRSSRDFSEATDDERYDAAIRRHIESSARR